MSEFNLVFAVGLISVTIYRAVKNVRSELKLSRSKAVLVALGQMLVVWFIFFGSYLVLRSLFASLIPLSNVLHVIFFLISFGLTAYAMKKMDSLLAGAWSREY